MSPLTCGVVRRRLQAFHDGELSLDYEVAVTLHLDVCPACADEVRRLRAIGDALRRAATRQQPTSEELGAVHDTLVGRIRAEHEQSWGVCFGRLFEDMHFVWAGLGASVAMLLCVGVTVGMLHRVADERADSLAAILSVLASPGSNANPIRLDGRMRFPRVFPDDAMPAVLVRTATQQEDVVFTLAGVITREGRLADLEMLASAREQLSAAGVLHAASTARAEPARFANTPVAVNLVWLLARTTVRPRGT